MKTRQNLPAEHRDGLTDALATRPDFINLAYVAGWRFNGAVWTSPCGHFVEETARAACRIDGLAEAA